MMVDSVYDKDTTYDWKTTTEADKKKFFDSLTFKQFQAIGEFVATMPKVVVELDVVCNAEECDHSQHLVVQDILSFLA